MLRSLLDRLIDLEPDNPVEPVRQRTPHAQPDPVERVKRRSSYEELRASVERDLENLLNTKCFVTEPPETMPHLGRSLLMYGLSDYTARNPSTPSVRTQLRQEIERVINLFEPRLKNVSVRVQAPEGVEPRVRFAIAAMLQVDDEAEPVNFDTYYDSTRSEYRIRS